MPTDTTPAIPATLADLPPVVQDLLANLITAAQATFQHDLLSMVLFGSGATGALRATSDINLLFILAEFEPAKVNAFREPLRLARVAARVAPMFVLESELPAAAEAFAVKFDDIERRHRVLFGADLVAGLVISRDAKIQRLRQVLINFTIRLRERYLAASLREEQLAAVIADAAAPLRSAAATLLELEGHHATSPKTALVEITRDLAGDWSQALELVSTARETGAVPAGTAVPVVFQLLKLAGVIQSRVDGLH